jgi:phosphate/sulfate permease
VARAPAFNCRNGFPDAANSMATIGSTRVLKPYQAARCLRRRSSARALFRAVSPVLGLARGALIRRAIRWLFFRLAPFRLDRGFRRLQRLASAFYSLGHGRNDAQKTRGQKPTTLRPASGCAASAGGALTRFIAPHFGIPVSTTHTTTGAIPGADAVQNPSKVRWAGWPPTRSRISC